MGIDQIAERCGLPAPAPCATIFASDFAPSPPGSTVQQGLLRLPPIAQPSQPTDNRRHSKPVAGGVTMMKKECRVSDLYKEGSLGSLVFTGKADPGQNEHSFSAAIPVEGWEVKTMSVERRRTAPCSGRGSASF